MYFPIMQRNSYEMAPQYHAREWMQHAKLNRRRDAQPAWSRRVVDVYIGGNRGVRSHACFVYECKSAYAADALPSELYFRFSVTVFRCGRSTESFSSGHPIAVRASTCCRVPAEFSSRISCPCIRFSLPEKLWIQRNCTPRRSLLMMRYLCDLCSFTPTYVMLPSTT